MKLTLRRPCVSAAFTIVAALCAAEVSHAGPAAENAVGAQAARVIGREQSAFEAEGAARVTALVEAMRPRARTDADEDITVASRSIDPVSAAELASGKAAKPALPAKLDLDAVDTLPPAAGADAQAQCLAQAIYFESRGEPLAGQIAVAEVVLNRVDDRHFPSTVCGVTRQGVGSGRGCQFSYACDGNSDAMKSALARERCEKLAQLMLAGRPRTVTKGATYFHTRSIRPDWSRRMTRTAEIGHHMFYRSGGTRVAGG